MKTNTPKFGNILNKTCQSCWLIGLTAPASIGISLVWTWNDSLFFVLWWIIKNSGFWLSTIEISEIDLKIPVLNLGSYRSWQQIKNLKKVPYSKCQKFDNYVSVICSVTSKIATMLILVWYFLCHKLTLFLLLRIALLWYSS